MIFRNVASALALTVCCCSSALASIYKTSAETGPLDAPGGSDRDQIYFPTNITAFPSGSARVTITPKIPQDLTAIIYKTNDVEITRFSSSDRKPLSFTLNVPATGQTFVIRVVPTGGTRDHPVGGDWRIPVANATNNALLGSYRFNFSDGNPGLVPTKPKPVLAANQTASLPASQQEPQPAKRATTTIPAGRALDAAKPSAAQWGALAQLAETVWTEGQDQALAINWEVPGRRLELRRFGLWGREQIAVEPDSTGLLRAKIVMPDGVQRDAALAVTKTGYTILADGEREVCQLAKATITCKLEVANGKKWAVDRVWAWKVSNTAAVEKLLSELPGVFPERSPGSFDKFRGVAAASTDRIYRGQNGGMGVSILDGDSQSPDRLKYFSFDTEGMPIDYRSFKREDGGQFVAAIPTPTGERTALVTYVGLGVGARGQTRIYNLDGSRISISTSIDGSMILRETEIKTGNDWRRKSYDILSEPRKYQNDSTAIFFKSFIGKIFMSYYSRGWENFFTIENLGENIFKISQYGGTSSVANYARAQDIFNLSIQCIVFFKSDGLLKQDCSHKSGERLQKESKYYEKYFRIDSNGKAYLFKNAENRLEIEEYVIQTDGGLKDNDQIYIQDYFSNFASEVRYADLRRLQYELRMGYVEDRAREEAERQAFFAGLSAMTRNLGVDTSNPSALLRPTTPAEWAARSPSASTTRGGMGDMGGISRTEAPRMTPQQQAQFDELERIKMREQTARGERPTTIAEDAQARMAGQGAVTGGQIVSEGTRNQSSGSGPSSRSSQSPAPDRYAYCWAVRAASVPKAGMPANRTLSAVDADRVVRTRYVSQIGRVSQGRLASGRNWSTVMADWSMEFLSVAPQLNGSWHITQRGDGACKIADSWDEISQMMETDNRLWRENQQASARSKDEITVQPVMWSPSN